MAITSVATPVQGHAKNHNAADIIPSSGSPSALLGFQTGDAIEFDWDSAAATADTIAARDANGDIIVPTTPTASGAAASKSYVDSSFQGLVDRKEACRVATTVELTTWIAAGSGVGKTLTAPGSQTSHNDIDGVTVAVGNRVLVKDGGPNASPNVDNGIYEVTQIGNSIVPLILTRATDADADADVNAGMSTWVSEGSTQADQFYAIDTNDPITVDTTAVTFVQVGGASGITAGAALTKTGNTLDVNVDGTTIEVTTDALNVVAGGIGTTQLADLGVTEAKTSFRDADVTLAGAAPVIADFSGIADGEEALAVGTDNSLWLLAQRNAGGSKQFAVQLGLISS